MPTIITYGTFDLLHFGHINMLLRAKEYGDRLIVGCSTDKFNQLKGKEALQPYSLRKKVLESLPIVDLVIPERTWAQKVSDIKKYKAKTFVIGVDWSGKFDDLPCEVLYLSRTEGISSTELKDLL